MEKLDPIQIDLLEAISGLHEIPEGAYNIRANGGTAARHSTDWASIFSSNREPKGKACICRFF